MYKTSDTILGLVAIVVATGTALILLAPVPSVAVGAGFTLLSAILLTWHAVAVASSKGQGVVALIRPPWVLLGCNVLIVGASLLPA